MNLPKDVRRMSLGARGKEILRLRRAILLWAKATDNARCHEEDDRLARVVGLRGRGKITLDSCKFLRNCRNYVRIQVSCGKMTKGETS